MTTETTYPLDFVPDEIPFDTSYGPPISLDPSPSGNSRCGG
jgi:hypothetical protein